jgi:hypothetical protein
LPPLPEPRSSLLLSLDFSLLEAQPDQIAVVPMGAINPWGAPAALAGKFMNGSAKLEQLSGSWLLRSCPFSSAGPSAPLRAFNDPASVPQQPSLQPQPQRRADVLPAVLSFDSGTQQQEQAAEDLPALPTTQQLQHEGDPLSEQARLPPAIETATAPIRLPPPLAEAPPAEQDAATAVRAGQLQAEEAAQGAASPAPEAEQVSRLSGGAPSQPANSTGQSAQEQKAACTDNAPDRRFTCAQQRQFGKCQALWMLQGGWCARTCGRCQLPAEP